MSLERAAALGFGAAPILLTLAQWGALRVARRSRQKETLSKPPASAIWRLAGFAGLAGLGFIAFPVAFFALVASFVWLPWPLSLPLSVALLVTGLAGISAAFLVLRDAPRSTNPIRISGYINVAVLAWCSLLILFSGGLPDWFQPGVRTGAGYLKKKLLLSFDDIGDVTDIDYGEVRSGRGVELAVAGNYGAKFFGQSNQLDASVNFDVPKPYPRYAIDIVPQSSANPLMFFRHSDWSEYDSLIDAGGKEIWRTPHGCLTSAFGDLNGDSAPEFICVQSKPECCTIEARDPSNRIVWQSPGDWVFNLALFDHGSTPAILLDQGTVGSSSLALRGLSDRGEQLFERQPAVSLLGGFSAVHWPGVCDRCLLVAANNEFSLLTADGTKIVTHLAPASYVSNTRSVAVRFGETGPPILAVVGEMEYKRFGNATFHGMLMVFDASGKLFYSEVFPERAEAVAAIPSSDGKRDILLVGGENKVWAFTPGTL